MITRFELWLVRRLLDSLFTKAVKLNDHHIADNVITIDDALIEIAKGFERQ